MELFALQSGRGVIVVEARQHYAMGARLPTESRAHQDPTASAPISETHLRHPAQLPCDLDPPGMALRNVLADFAPCGAYRP